MPCQQWEMYSQRQRLRHRQRRRLTQAAAAKRALFAAFVRRNLLHLLLPTRSKIFTDIPKQLMKWTNLVNFPKPFTAFTVSMNHWITMCHLRSEVHEVHEVWRLLHSNCPSLWRSCSRSCQRLWCSLAHRRCRRRQSQRIHDDAGFVHGVHGVHGVHVVSRDGPSQACEALPRCQQLQLQQLQQLQQLRWFAQAQELDVEELAYLALWWDRHSRWHGFEWSSQGCLP